MKAKDYKIKKKNTSAQSISGPNSFIRNKKNAFSGKRKKVKQKGQQHLIGLIQSAFFFFFFIEMHLLYVMTGKEETTTKFDYLFLTFHIDEHS